MVGAEEKIAALVAIHYAITYMIYVTYCFA